MSLHAPLSSPPMLSQCPGCGAALAPDQRYCLSCGRRLGDPRVDFRSALHLEPAPEPVAVRRRDWAPERGALLALAAVAAVILALGVGIVIGRGKQPAAVASRPTIVTVAGGTAAPSTTAPAATAEPAGAITDDWPSGASGYTIELSTLDNATADLASVSAAEATATDKGAPGVGVLNGDEHDGTPSGKYVIYSGRYRTAAEAKAALAKLGSKFPGALVLHVTPQGSSSANDVAPVSSQGLSQAAAVSHLSGAAYEKAAAKLPSQIGTGGTPPPVDNQKPGGGTSGTCIGC